jgi:hypothetical protein
MARQAHNRPGAPAVAVSGGAEIARGTCFKAKRAPAQCGHRLAQIVHGSGEAALGETAQITRERRCDARRPGYRLRRRSAICRDGP